jgi:hypothetical protein
MSANYVPINNRLLKPFTLVIKNVLKQPTAGNVAQGYKVGRLAVSLSFVINWSCEYLA